MPLIIPNQLPAAETLQSENIFTMERGRASTLEIRPLKIVIVNLMPTKIATETQLARVLSNTPLQVEMTLVTMGSHESTHISQEHMNSFYKTIDEIKDQYFDGMMLTGAPVEKLPYEQVDYWKELSEIFEFAKTNVYSSMFICWGAQAALYYHYGIDKHIMDHKVFGVFEHKVLRPHNPLVRGFDEYFYAPHSRHTEVPIADIHACKDLTVLAESEEAGLFLAMAEGGRKIFVMGHPEYDRVTLDGEYKRDLAKGLPIEIPKNYYKDDDPNNKPLLTWRAHANNLYTNWLNYYVYQSTPYDLYGTPDFREL